MATTIERIRAKLTRADQHIEDFQLRSAAFYETDPYLVGTEDDPQAGQRVYRLIDLKPIPEILATIVADALQNLRSPLDYLATQIETAACNTKPKHRVYFPIGRNAAHYIAVRRAYIQCAGQAAIDAFDATEPYKGGRGEALWQLHELNKPDKHDLPLTVWAGYQGADIMPFAIDSPGWSPDALDLMRQMGPIFIRPADRLCPLQVGYELLREPLHLAVHEKRKFMLEVSLHEPGVIECEPALKTLKDFSNLVRDIVTSFEPLLP
jgi:hypothetical protein